MKPIGVRSCALLLVLCALSGVEAADWVLLGRGVNDFVYVDKQSIKRPAKGIVRAWVKYTQVNPTDPVKEMIDHEEFDCVEVKYHTLTGTLYYRNGTTRKRTSSEVESWKHIPSETVAEGILNYLCGK